MPKTTDMKELIETASDLYMEGLITLEEYKQVWSKATGITDAKHPVFSK